MQISRRSRFKLILTGTPVQNNLSETYALLHYLAPNIFDTDCGAAFASCFSLNGGAVGGGASNGGAVGAVGGGGGVSSVVSGASASSSSFSTAATVAQNTGAKLTKVLIDRQALNAAHYMLRPFVLRRVKTEVEQKLPPKLETLIKCPLSEMQRFWIKALLMKESSALMKHFAAHGEDGADQQSGGFIMCHQKSLYF